MPRAFPTALYTSTVQHNGTSKRRLTNTSPGTTDSLATKGPAVTQVASQAYYVTPEAVAVASALRAVGTASGIGWALVPSNPNTLVPLNTDGFTMSAGTFTVQMVAQRDTALTSADQTIIPTVMLFRADATGTIFYQELGRGTIAGVSVTVTKTAFPITVNTPAVTFGPGEVLWLEMHVDTYAVSVTGSTASFSTNSDTAIRATSSGITYVANFVKQLNEAVPVSETLARRTSVGRTLSDSVAAADSITRTGTYRRSISDSTTPVTDSVTRKFVANRALSDAVQVTDIIARGVTITRQLADSVPLSDALTRQLIYSRALADALATGGGGTTVVNNYRPILLFED